LPTTSEGTPIKLKPEKARNTRARNGAKLRRRLVVLGRSTADVASLLEETINRIRQGPFDLRAANTIGFLAGTLLKALDKCRIERHLLNLEARWEAREERMDEPLKKFHIPASS
jgi:hypothetical protein